MFFLLDGLVPLALHLGEEALRERVAWLALLTHRVHLLFVFLVNFGFLCSKLCFELLDAVALLARVGLATCRVGARTRLDDI